MNCWEWFENMTSQVLLIKTVVQGFTVALLLNVYAKNFRHRQAENR